MMLSKPKTQDIHLSINNRAGSVEHYFHFLLGFLIPLVLVEEETKESSNHILIRSCGLMDRHLQELSSDRIKIVSKAQHENIRAHDKSGRHFKFVKRMGYDCPSHYRFEDFSVATLVLINVLYDNIAKHCQHLNHNKEKDDPFIVMIDREPPDSFYLSCGCEIQGAGTSRRSIPNFDELFMQTSSKYSHAKKVTLEGKSLAYQIALFKEADVIIAQHGASLANLVWCKPNTTVIEIYPADLIEEVKQRDYFQNLANCMGLNYQRVDQKECHSNVDLDALLSALNYVNEAHILKQDLSVFLKY